MKIQGTRRTMGHLFPLTVEQSDIPAIPGLMYLPVYVTETDEAQLVAAIDREAWDTTWERRRQLYGASYGTNTGAERPIPKWAHALIERFHAEGISERPFDQVLV